MPQSNPVRTSVPAQDVSPALGAVAGFGRHFALQQAKEQQEKENLMSILPALASIRAIAPAEATDQGAIDIGSGNFIKITTPQVTESEKLAAARTRKIDYEMSPEGMAAQATADYMNDNAILFAKMKPEEKQQKQEEYYNSALSVFQKGEGGEQQQPKVPLTDTKTGKTAMVTQSVAAQMMQEKPGQYTVGGGEGGGEEGGMGLGRMAAALPLAAWAGRGAFRQLPSLIKGGGKMFGPYGVAASALLTGAGMYNDYQRSQGGRTLFGAPPDNINQAPALPQAAGQITPQRTTPLPQYGQ